MPERLDTALKNRAIESAPIGVVVTDATAADDPIVFVNDRFTELTGYPEEVALGRNCRFLQGSGTDPSAVAELRDAVEATQATTVTLRNYRRDGEPFWNEVTVSPIEDDSGEVVNFVGFLRDVTERVEGERGLRRQKERFEQFASVISHDLKNPLNVLEVAVELAEETGDSEHFERALRTIDRMNEMIEDLLILAREGEAVGETTAVDLHQTIEDRWAALAADGATLENEATATIRADPARLGQLLENLLANAVEHGGADVTVAVGDLDGGFFVEDDGEGIPAERRDRVFDAGYTTARDGTGFGLQIVEQLASAHGWTVDVDDGPEGGARFEVTGVEPG